MIKKIKIMISKSINPIKIENLDDISDLDLNISIEVNDNFQSFIIDKYIIIIKNGYKYDKFYSKILNILDIIIFYYLYPIIDLFYQKYSEMEYRLYIPNIKIDKDDL
jgi:hypothetical protein